MEPIGNTTAQTVAISKALFAKSLHFHERSRFRTHNAINRRDPLVRIFDNVGNLNCLGCPNSPQAVG